MERLRELPCRGEPVGRRAGQRLGYHLLERWGHRFARLVHRTRAFGETAHEDHLGGGPRERRLADQHLVEHAPEAVDVGPAVEAAFAGGLLGAHIRRRAHRHPGLGELLLGHQAPCDAKVGHQGRAVLRQQDVLRLDVAVDHAVLVGVFEGAGRFAGDLHGVVQRQLALAAEPVAQRLALDVGHGEPELSGSLARVEHGQDVGVLQPGGKVDLAEEPLRPEARGQLGVKHLERDGAAVLEVLRQPDRSHATAAELALERVLAGQVCLNLLAQIGQWCLMGWRSGGLAAPYDTPGRALGPGRWGITQLQPGGRAQCCAILLS
jgi:hypothetical protein